MAPPSVPRKPVGSGATVSISEIELVRGNTTKESPTTSLLASKQEGSTTTQEPNKSRCLSDLWAVELVALLVSALSIIGVIITLRLYDNRLLAQWPLRISLNTVISVLSQIGQTALMLPVVSCIGQLKWLWFVQPKSTRTLADFEAFDDASRGPWASLLLIWRTYASHLVSLGAALAIAALGFQPFTQQAVSFVQRLTPSGAATISSCSNITEYLIGEQVSAPLSYWAAIYEAFSSPNQSLSDITASCSTGNCTFDPYYSLAICPYPVVNLTSQLKTTSNWEGVDCSGTLLSDGVQILPNCTFSLPNRALLNAMENEITVASASLPGVSSTSSIAHLNMTGTLPIDFFVIYYSNNTYRVEALECAMRFCGQTYSSSVNNGETVTRLTDTWGQLTPGNFYDGVFYLLEEGSVTFSVEYMVPVYLAAASSQIFSGTNPREQPGTNPASPAAQAIWTTLTTNDEMSAMTSFMNNMAISLTNSLRTSQSSTQITGTLLALDIYVSVSYEWLIFPITLVLLTLTFLLATVMKSRYHGIQPWKTSSLAVLGGLDRETRVELGNVRSVGDMLERAKDLKPAMRRRGHGWSLGVNE